MIVFIHIPKTAGVSIRVASASIGQAFKTLYHEPVKSAYLYKNLKDTDFVITSIRNPYDRAVSLFYFLRKNTGYSTRFICDQTVSQFWETFNEHVTFTQPQCYFLKDANNKVSERINKIIRFETLKEDWRELQQNYNLPSLPHENINETRPAIHWQDELTHAAIERIGEIYADDFEHLGYKRLY